MRRTGWEPPTAPRPTESGAPSPTVRGWLALAVVALAGCAAPIDESWRAAPRYPYRSVAPPETAPPLLHCNDRTGHIPGTQPWIYGGDCTCNPSVELLRDFQENDWLLGWAVDTLEATYRTLGVATLREHRGCNNLCEYGPHVVKGGRCLVPPTPGTVNWEEVVTGEYALPPWDVDRVFAHGGPIEAVPLPGAPPDPNDPAPSDPPPTDSSPTKPVETDAPPEDPDSPGSP